MRKVKISADSTCDLGSELLAKYDIAIQPLHIILGDQAFRDGVDMTPDEIEDTKKIQQNIFNFGKDAIMSGKWDLVIMDEIMAAITLEFVELQDVIDLVKNKPKKVELVMTGRNAPDELVEIADYVSEIKPVKHPMEKGIKARKGIES